MIKEKLNKFMIRHSQESMNSGVNIAMDSLTVVLNSLKDTQGGDKLVSVDDFMKLVSELHDGMKESMQESGGE